MDPGEKAVRLGHPARVLPELRAHTLDLMVAEHPDVRLARKLVKEAMGLFRRAARFTRARPEPGARSEARQEAIGELMADSPYRHRFVNGQFMHAFLSPNDYHRQHAPVAGTVVALRRNEVPGT